ncbi:hypothetical protein FA95DRAFT_861355 [Auriscalpium vulgare]|uniref:Uncharacterized protein n=1 Tax=Auriscalpium vulgare TaxID=40419 RepID=A0ACB8RZK6_9AGAM|nr:hypothetical protein FA95DRAFT_861355 [Auriscalpium vulgare]
MSSSRNSRRRDYGPTTVTSGHGSGGWSRGSSLHPEDTPPRTTTYEQPGLRTSTYDQPAYTETPFQAERVHSYVPGRMEHTLSGRAPQVGLVDPTPQEAYGGRSYTTPPGQWPSDRSHRRESSPADPLDPTATSRADWTRASAASQYAGTQSPNTGLQRMYNGVDATILLNRLPYPPRPEETSSRELIEAHTVGLVHMEEDPMTDVRLRLVSLGFPIAMRRENVFNARAAHSAHSTTSIVDVRFVRLAGLLQQMTPLRIIDRVEIREVGTGRPYRVYGRVSVPFNAGRWAFDVLCWVVDLSSPVEILLGNDWLNRYKAKISLGLEGMKIDDARAPSGPSEGVSDHYEEAFP